MEFIFKTVSVALALSGLYFIWKGDFDGVFVSLALSACSVLLIMRFRAKQRLALRKDN